MAPRAWLSPRAGGRAPPRVPRADAHSSFLPPLSTRRTCSEAVSQRKDGSPGAGAPVVTAGQQGALCNEAVSVDNFGGVPPPPVRPAGRWAPFTLHRQGPASHGCRERPGPSRLLLPRIVLGVTACVRWLSPNRVACSRVARGVARATLWPVWLRTTWPRGRGGVGGAKGQLDLSPLCPIPVPEVAVPPMAP